MSNTTSSIHSAFVPIYALLAKDTPKNGITKEHIQTVHSKRIADKKEPNWFEKRSLVEIIGGVLGIGGIIAGIASYFKESKIGKWLSGIVTAGGIGAIIAGILNSIDLKTLENSPTTNESFTENRLPSIDVKTDKDFYNRLDYSDVIGKANDIGESGKRYATALAIAANTPGGTDDIERVSKELRSRFKAQMGKIDIKPSIYGESESWSLWDIGKQLHLLANPSESSNNYRLANPLTDQQLQEEMVYRMIGWEILGGEKRSSYELTDIGKKAVQEVA